MAPTVTVAGLLKPLIASCGVISPESRRVPITTVITSYSIHYTKLYDLAEVEPVTFAVSQQHLVGSVNLLNALSISTGALVGMRNNFV